MNSDSPHNLRAELETRITALLLDELNADDADLLRKLIDHDVELKKLHDQLQRTIELVKESAVEMPEKTPAAPLKLSDERRQKLLAHFKTVKLPRVEERSRKLSRLIPLAASAAVVMLLGFLLLPALSRAKLKSKSVESSASVATGIDPETAQLAEGENLRRFAREIPPTPARTASSFRASGIVLPAARREEGIAETELGGVHDPHGSDFYGYDGNGDQGRRQAQVTANRDSTLQVAKDSGPGGRMAGGFGGGGVGAAGGRSAESGFSADKRDEDADSREVPLLGDVPVLGRAFRLPSLNEQEVALNEGRIQTRIHRADPEWFEENLGYAGVLELSGPSVAATTGAGAQRGGGARLVNGPGIGTEGSGNDDQVPASTAPAAPAQEPGQRVLRFGDRGVAAEPAKPTAKATLSVDGAGNVVATADEAGEATLKEIAQATQRFGSAGIQIVEERLGDSGGSRQSAKVSTVTRGDPAEIQGALQETFGRDRVAGARTNAAAALQEPEFKKPASVPPVPQPEVQVRENPFSTFSLNVSDVSFKLAAASLQQGVMPDVGSVRTEEFINAFDYRDPEPAPGAPVAFAWERARYPFAHHRDLLRFSIKAAATGRPANKPLNLVVLLDSSGSMERADRVAIVRAALRVLARQLQPQDRISIVTFARAPRLWVDGVPGSQAGETIERLLGLTPEGGTNLEEAMNLAYATALKHYAANGINRVVLLTDGAANLGDVQPESLKKTVEAHRRQGVALDCFGVGWEGYNDELLEQLSRNGDGRYGFINSPEEAVSGFAAQLAGALQVAASDVKVQVEFNPRRVISYRQLGYAKHQLTKEQFRDNTVDAAELAAAESGNALYTVEVNPSGEGPIATVRVRFKVPGTTDYREHAWPVPYTGNAVALEQASPSIRLAATAAAFAEWLVSSPYAADVTPDKLLGYLRGVPEVCGADRRPSTLEWMVRQAKSISGRGV